MARPGYVEARKTRDREFSAVKELEQRLANIELLADKDGRPYSDELKEIHRRDTEPALEAHRKALEIAEATFAAYSRQPIYTTPRKYYDVIISLHLSVTKDMFDSVNRVCEKKGILRTQLFRDALDMYLKSQADG